ncbi:adenylate/guanylate cyclase domain-containing protein [Ferruginivarius sediminum]|uniref:Adenylate/guanylate cyclase domain-containing protein n=1 Tax=Ferruginivarius sediminum TaxID=2661937 RepID=A0A369TAH3_9PROT|nr:adenylate/guanylate cyclase domain-containing protein [Ferruginivarius sediminum]
MNRRRPALLIVLLLPFIAVAAALPFLRNWPLLAAIEESTLDWRFALRGARVPDAPVVILAIDDRTVSANGGWPLPREVLAQAIDRMTASGAGVIALDLLFAESGETDQADLALAGSIRRSQRTVLPVALTFKDKRGEPQTAHEAMAAHTLTLVRRPGAPEIPGARGALPPVSVLAEAARGLGHVDVVLGEDGALRQIHPAVEYDGLIMPALPVSIARLLDDRRGRAFRLDLPGGLQVGGRHVAVGLGGRWTLNFYGPEGTFPTYSLQALLAGRLPSERLNGAVVWVGATATAIGDTFVTPFDRKLPGVEGLATATANLLADGFIVRNEWAALTDMLAVIVVGAATAAAARRPSALQVIAISPLPVAIWFAVTVLAFSHWGIWLNLTVPGLTGLATGSVIGAWDLALSDSQRRRLSAYIPGPVASALTSTDRPAFEGRTQPAAVLFVDMADFTAQSELAGLDATVSLLRRLHAMVEEVAAAHGGYVDSFSGDGAMLVFGVPNPSGTDASNALACAHALLSNARKLDLEVRVGVHWGELRVARFGGKRFRQITVAGDTVNLASRLVEAAKMHEARLAASDALVSRIEASGGSDPAAHLRKVPAVHIRGRRTPTDIWLKSG